MSVQMQPTWEEFEKHVKEAIDYVKAAGGIHSIAHGTPTSSGGLPAAGTPEVDYGSVLERLRAQYNYDMNSAKALLCRYAVREIGRKS